MVLTERQRTALEGAILEYLRDQKYDAAAEALANQMKAIDSPKQSKYLEKKWTTVLKLEKKIQDLESQCKRLEHELKNTNPMSNVFQSRNRNKDTVPKELKCKLTGHRGGITHVQFHPSFAVIVSSSEDNTLRIWDPESGQVERIMKGHTDSVNHFDFHPDGSQLASCSSDLSIKIWDFEQKFNCKRTLTGHEHTVSKVAFADGGAKLVSTSRDKTIRIWETDTGYCIKTITGHNEWVKSLCCLPNSTYIGTGSHDKTVRVWDTTSGKQITEIRGFEGHVESIAFGTEKNDAIVLKDWEEEVDEAVYYPNIIAVGTRDNWVKIFNILSGEVIMEFNGHNNWVRDLCFHPNGKFLISVSDDSSVRVWDLSKRRCYYTLEEAHENFIQCCSWNRQLGLFATGGADNQVNVWACS